MRPTLTSVPLALLLLPLCGASCAIGHRPAPIPSLPEAYASSVDAPRLGGGASKSFHFLLGSRALDNDAYWSPVDEQVMFGIQYDSKLVESPVGIEAALSYGTDVEDSTIVGLPVSLRSDIFELSAGVRATLDLAPTPIALYAGVGPTLLIARAELEVLGAEASLADAGAGVYVHGGVDFFVDDRLSLGLDLRSVFGSEIALEDGGTVLPGGDADYAQVALTFGIHW